MSYTMTDIQTLQTHQCGQCGIVWAMPRNFVAARRDDRATFYCPNGHPRAFIESDADRLRKELQQANERASRWQTNSRHQQDQREAAERSNSALRGVVTRQKNRAAAGVCPAGCKRHFANLARHMHTQHPDYAEAVPDGQ